MQGQYPQSQLARFGSLRCALPHIDGHPVNRVAERPPWNVAERPHRKPGRLG
jgi:hypothetical protein